MDEEKNELMGKFDENEIHNDLEDIIPNGPNKYENINDNLHFDNNDTFTFEKPKSVYKKKPEDSNFPFTQGKGIIHCIKLFDEPNQSNDNPLNFTKDLSQDSISSTKSKNKDILSQTLTEKNSTYNFNEEENSLYSEQTVNINDDSLFKFTTKKYFYTPNGKRRRIKKNRKYKSDDIRKKIKSRFHKTLKNIINENLKKAGSKKLFDFLPQCFIGNVSKKTNNFCLNLTFRELLLKDFVTEANKESYPNKDVDYKKYLKNKDTLEYLDCDYLIIAMGFLGTLDDDAKSYNIKTNRNRISLNDFNYDNNIYVCGDMKNGQSLVVVAIKDGIDCATKIIEKYR